MHNITQTIKYRGKVVVKAIKDGKETLICETHNQGGSPLFAFLNKCLIGAYDTSLRPKYITASDENDTRIIPLYPVSRTFITTARNVQYTFTVPAASFGSGTFKIKKLYLYCDAYRGSSETLSDWSAQIELDNIETFNTTAQDTLIIEWTLALSSTDEEE